MEAGLSRVGGLPSAGLTVVVGLVLRGWDQPELAVQAPVVVPVDVLGEGDLQVVDPVPWALVSDQLGLEQRVECLGHRVIVGIADRSDRSDRLDLGESLAVAHRRVLHAAVGMMNQVGEVRGGVLTGPDAMFRASKARSV